MTGGVLTAVIVAIVVVCCIGPIAVCAFGGVFNRVFQTAAAGGAPTTEITSCTIDQGTVLGSARIEYKITNHGSAAKSYVVELEVTNSSGAKVGSISDYVPTVNPGATVSADVLVILERPGGKDCKISDVT